MWDGERFGDGATAAATRSSIYAITGVTKSVFKHVIIRAGSTNTGIFYLGSSAVTGAGLHAKMFLKADESVTLENAEFDPTTTYAISSNGADYLFVSLVTG